MSRHQEDTEADIKPVVDRAEAVSMMEPLLIGNDLRHRVVLTDLVLDLVQKSAGFRYSLPESLLKSLAWFLRAAHRHSRRRPFLCVRSNPRAGQPVVGSSRPHPTLSQRAALIWRMRGLPLLLVLVS